ncbi:MAG: hypothetical protein IPM54_04980 [Polyangiaceae bacterium]|nr:hypothetical protein [Polyangiaceae bacterium]
MARLLLDSIRRCWASLFNERAVAYRADRGIDPRVATSRTQLAFSTMTC